MTNEVQSSAHFVQTGCKYINLRANGGSGKAMTGQQLLKFFRLTSLVEWTTMKFRSGNETTKDMTGQQLLDAAIQGEASQLMPARCNVNHQTKSGATVKQPK